MLGTLQSAGSVPLLIDDAQWADRAPLQALGFALRRLQAHRVLTVMVSRSALPRGHQAGFHRLIEDGHGAWVRVRGLDSSSIRDRGSLMGVDHHSSRSADRLGFDPGANAAGDGTSVPHQPREPGCARSRQVDESAFPLGTRVRRVGALQPEGAG